MGMNRAQRRAEARRQERLPSWLPARKEERVKRLMQQGISPQDLVSEYEKGFKEGFTQASIPMVKSCYAAICLALHDLYGFGSKRCMNVLNCVDDKLISTLTSTDAIDEVWEKIGLEINFSEPFDRIEERKNKPGKEEEQP